MKKYQFQAVEELETALLNTQIRCVMRKNNIKERIFIEILKNTISAIKGEHEKTCVQVYIPYLDIIVRKMPIENQAKMKLFFDLIEPIYPKLENGWSVTSEFFDEIEKLGIEYNEFCEVCCNTQEQELEVEIQKRYPNKYRKINKLLETHKRKGNYYKEQYLNLKKYYFDEFRKPVIDDLPKIEESLKGLIKNQDFANLIMGELSKIAKKKSEKVIKIKGTKEPKNYDFSNLNLKVESKRVMTEKEWKELNQRVDNYYNTKGFFAIKGLNNLEKYELIKDLRTLFYKEEQIENILWDIDRRYLQDGKSTLTTNSNKNVIIFYNIVKKSIQNCQWQFINQNTLETYETYINSNEEEKEIWKNLLYETIEQDNKTAIEALNKIHDSIMSLPYHQRKFWKETYLDEIEYKKDQSVYVMYLIRNMIKISKTKEERDNWKNELFNTIKRMELEGIGYYEFELNQGKARKKTN